MKNFWIVTENPFVTWVADLSPLRDNLDTLLSLVNGLINVGEAEAVFHVVAAPVIDYQRERDGALTDVLARRYMDTGQVDLFAFTGAAMAAHSEQSSQVRARMAWYNADGQRVDGWIDEPAQILHEADPNDILLPPGFKKRYPPVRITGPLVPQSSGEMPNSITIRLELHSDIWFPWIYGAAHPLHDYKRMFDNRPLARFHTPRLNRFLAAARELVTAAGGSWEIDDEESARNHLFMVEEAGIAMDAEPPGGAMPDAAVNAPWA